MTTIQLSELTRGQIDALGKMHEESVKSIQENYTRKDGFMHDLIRKDFGYTIYAGVNENYDWRWIETDLTKEQFIEKVKQYL